MQKCSRQPPLQADHSASLPWELLDNAQYRDIELLALNRGSLEAGKANMMSIAEMCICSVNK